MPELSHQEIFDNEGHINYDKVVEIIHLNLKNFLNAILEESFNLAKDDSYRSQINETNNGVCDQALDAYLERKHIVFSEFYVELESRFYTSHSVILQSQNIDQSDTNNIDTDLIELALAIDQLIELSNKRHSDLINKLTLQLEKLSFIADQVFNVSCLQPQDFYKLIQNCIAPLNISADGKILIGKLLYQNISQNLNDFYIAMHSFLLDVDINLTEDSKSNTDNQDALNTPTDGDPSNSSIMSMSTGQFYASVEQEMRKQEYKEKNEYLGEKLNTPEIIDEIAMDVYGVEKTGLDEITVSLLLQPYSQHSQSNSSPAQRRQFVRALSSVQQAEASSNAIFNANQIKAAVRRTLHEKGALDAEEIVDNEEKLIDFISNIFQVIHEDNSICNAMKSILARLKISTIKLALIDFTFFQNAKHPTRQLLNKLASIGIGSNEIDEAIFKRLSAIIRNITDSFETDVRIFELALSEIQKIDTASLKHQTTKKKPELNKHKLKSQRSAAKRVVIHTIKKLTKNKEIPNQILEFCLKCWAPHMAYVYMNYGRSAREWRKAVRSLRRTIEVSQGKHSFQEVSQYIHDPNVFFENIRVELEYLNNCNDEFEKLLDEAEVWYLIYLRKIEQEAKDLENHSSTFEPQVNEHTKEQDNVIHLFKYLSPTPDSVIDSFDSKKDKTPDQIEIIDNHEANQTHFHEEASEDIVDSLFSDSTEQPLDIEEHQEQEEIEEPEEQKDLISELDSETEFDDNDIEEEPELNVTEHLPESIAPGAWLEIYQGKDRAKRRLKFSKKIVETNYLVFSDRSGDYSFEIDLQTFLDDLSTGRSNLINESNRFDLALSSVISNIRSSQDNVDTK